jgi:hypothetical protein
MAALRGRMRRAAIRSQTEAAAMANPRAVMQLPRPGRFSPPSFLDRHPVLARLVARWRE